MNTVLRNLRRSLASIRDDMDGRLHPRRRSRAETEWLALAPDQVLVVCLGNVCRSPFCAALANQLADDQFQAWSAGFIGPGRAPPEEAQTAAWERGVDVSVHRSELVSTQKLEMVDAVLFFDRDNQQRLVRTPGVSSLPAFWLGDFDPEWAGKRAIGDPWGKSLDEFRATFGRIERCTRHALRVLGRA